MSSNRLKSNRSKAYALLLLNTILWGISTPIIKKALEFVTINQFLFGRYLLASLLFLPIYFLMQKGKKLGLRHANWPLLIFLAILGTPLTLIPLYEGIKLTSSLEASILVATGPLMVVLGGRLFLRERIERKEEFGLIVAILGTFLLTIEPLLSDGARVAFSLEGNALILISNLIWAAFLLLAKKTRANADQVSLLSYLVSVPVFLVLMLLESPQAIVHSQPFAPLALFGILYMAIFGSIIAFWAYAKGQEYIEASEASVFTYLQPIFTFPVAYLWLHEGFTPISLLACFVIALGVYISEYKS